MNVERINALADLIEHQPASKGNASMGIGPYEEKEGFNMRFIRHECGTPGCIAGYTNSMFGGDGFISARESLDLDRCVAGDLFWPAERAGRYGISPYWDAKPDHAARVLRHLSLTGKVEWEANA